MIRQKDIGAYICWIWQKVSSVNERGFQRFLDNVQYKSNGILCYERVFGQGFVSTGGIGQRVLDVGCGIGGGDFYMSQKYDVHVVGIHLSISFGCIVIESKAAR
ncbi:hypothetical protein IGI04_003396 [Brassica rapa subsp. trilocularis]|uniref:phosphoethanolamine N-methyltransferase n=1 Tax=Brassica rapa subsp. trilocularis TaxID=1813537 RepID=A0ABQ7P1Q1_BRACM|nr:hypothetical protein IGI04_003396 [Brassica rapa subsp. trilocularis]